MVLNPLVNVSGHGRFDQQLAFDLRVGQSRVTKMTHEVYQTITDEYQDEWLTCTR